MSEEKEQHNIENDKFYKIEASMITITITNKNKIRLHEIVRELLRLEAIGKLDAEELLASCEVL
jgi:hypothetical protein